MLGNNTFMSLPSLHLHVPLSERWEDNVVNFNDLLRLHAPAPAPSSESVIVRGTAHPNGSHGGVGIAANVTPEGRASGEEEERTEAESDGDGSETTPEETGPKKRARAEEDDYYDIDDPFIDDSEYREFEGVGVLRPVDRGFFVWKGPLDQVPTTKIEDDVGFKKRKGPRKARKNAGEGTSDKEDFELSAAGADGKAGQQLARAGDKKVKGKEAENAGDPSGPSRKRKRPPTIKEPPSSSTAAPTTPANPTTPILGSKGPLPGPKEINANTPKAPVEVSSVSQTDSSMAEKEKKIAHLPAELQDVFEELVNETSKETWEDKKNFPQRLKDMIAKIAEALDSIGADDAVLETLARLMTKIMPYNKLTMKNLVNRSLLPLRMARKRAVIQVKYDALQLKIKSELEGGNGTQDRQSAGGSEEDPTRRFTWNKDVRAALWGVIQAESELAEAVEALNLLHRRESTRDDAKMRKETYAKVQTFFPAGLVSTSDISRAYSIHKATQKPKELDVANTSAISETIAVE